MTSNDYRDLFQSCWRSIRWFRGDIPSDMFRALHHDRKVMMLLAGACYIDREPRLSGRKMYLGRQARPRLPA